MPNFQGFNKPAESPPKEDLTVISNGGTSESFTREELKVEARENLFVETFETIVGEFVEGEKEKVKQYLAILSQKALLYKSQGDIISANSVRRQAILIAGRYSVKATAKGWEFVTTVIIKLIGLL